ncbi:hypothetical protein ABZV61_38610 [Streptomyces sp900116325]|uniref:Uncharacterized protein n=1 Tax=Streptomyces sp. 900116325 TaxID=3154295 RepID=A0ABV2UM23_9ACTN
MARDQRSAFAAEIASLARKHKGADRAQTITKSGYTVLLTGMYGGNVGAIDITDPDGHKIRRADGWRSARPPRSPSSCGMRWKRTRPGQPSASASRASSP